MCSAQADVRFVPKADIPAVHSFITGAILKGANAPPNLPSACQSDQSNLLSTFTRRRALGIQVPPGVMSVRPDAELMKMRLRGFGSVAH